MVVQHLCHCSSLVDLPAASEGREQELAHMASAVHQLLVGVGEDPAREGLVDTPRVSCCSVAAARRVLLGGRWHRRRPPPPASRRLPADPPRLSLSLCLQRVAKAWLDMTRGYRQECKR